MRALIVIADFYSAISEGLLASCVSELRNNAVDASRVIRVPGALEIPYVIQQVAEQKTIDLAVALGCVIRGETYHFEVVSQVSAFGLQQVQLKTGVPIGNGIITVENQAQARDRLKKGKEAAQAALVLTRLKKHEFKIH